MLTPNEMKALEERVFAGGVQPEALMEEAGIQMAAAVRQFSPRPGVCLAVFGKGHNGGDALVTARILSESGWKVTLVPAFPSADWAPLTAKKWHQAGRCETQSAASLSAWTPPLGTPGVVLDGLLGIGASGEPREPVSSLCRFINAVRERTSVRVFALDIPSGVDGLTGAAAQSAVVADFTLCVGFVKSGLLADSATHHVGRLAILPLEALTSASPTPFGLECAAPRRLRHLWKRRPAEMHKGDAGRVTLVAGSRGTLGAAALAARGALRAGAGLVTLCVPEALYPMAASMPPPECMVRPVRSLREALYLRADSLGIGPGLGNEAEEDVLHLIKHFEGPAAVDADALNILARGNMDTLLSTAGPRLLTPHLGEMERLCPSSGQELRRQWVERFIQTWPVTLLLKGARTLVGTRMHGICANTTGNPGMASGGMGDVLTGVCAALLARGMPCHEAAILGAWLCGRAAEDLVLSGRRSEESLLASDVADSLGHAFSALREDSY